jgi:hypothetical protein
MAGKQSDAAASCGTMKPVFQPNEGATMAG